MAERRKPSGTPRNRQADPHADGGSSNVRVVCRLRPMSDWEKKTGTVPAVSASTERKEVAAMRTHSTLTGGNARQVRSTFKFDDVLTSFSTQDDAFNATLRPLVGEVLKGFEATAFAYGQTGTGKTYTMEGDLSSEESRGLVPRVAQELMQSLSDTDVFTEYSLQVSYLEIYNEELSDLLDSSDKKLELKDTGKEVRCVGLSEVSARSVNEILDLVRLAQDRRRVAETRINARSSRSHSIFTMKVRCRRKTAGGELENTGKLHLVDLAGSECAAKAASVTESDIPAAQHHPAHIQLAKASEEERERRNINQSLLTLGRVIAALRSGSGRVPYRDSKLTRLLQDALGGHCKTVVIATISPALSAVEETISTLSYAEQASGIKNRPTANSLYKFDKTASGRDNGAVQIQGSGPTSSDWSEMEMKLAYLTQEVEEAQSILARKHQEAQEFAEQLEESRAALDAKSTELEGVRHALEEKLFFQACTAEDADRLFQASQLFSVAHTACAAHGKSLADNIQTCRAKAEAVRHQARDLCEESKRSLAVVVESVGRAVDTAMEAAQEVHAAHCAAADVRAKSSTAQQKTLDDFMALVQEDVSKGDVLLSTAITGTENRNTGDVDEAPQVALIRELSTGVSVMESHADSIAALTTDTATSMAEAADRRKRLHAVVNDASQLHRATLAAQPLALRTTLTTLGQVCADGAATVHALEASTQAKLAHEIEDLRAQQQNEQEILSTLGRQRVALQAEADEVREKLQISKNELAAVRCRHMDLAQSQENGRKRLIEAVTGILNQEFASLGQEMKQETELISSGLDKIEASTIEAMTTTEKSRQRGMNDADEITDITVKWKETSDRSCEAFGEVGVEASQIRVALAELHANLSSHQAAATEQVGAWEGDGFKHTGTLETLTKCCNELDTEDSRTEGSLAQALNALGMGANDISNQIARAREEADFLVKAVEEQAVVFRDLGEAAKQAKAETNSLNTESLASETQELSRGCSAKVRTLEQLEEFRTNTAKSLEEQQKAIWSGFAAPPLAFLDGPGADEKADLNPPDAAKHPGIDVGPRRTDEQLRAEFRQIRGERPATTILGGVSGSLDKENSSAARIGKAGCVGGALRELNSEAPREASYDHYSPWMERRSADVRVKSADARTKPSKGAPMGIGHGQAAH